MNGPHLASALDIEHWADSLEARGELPRLVRRLIRQTNDQVIVLDMGAGEATGAPGYDGRVEAQRGTPFVPEGKSVWELGTGKDPKKKANEDYDTRTKDPLGVDQAATVFVFVTCRRWDGKREWEEEKRKDGKWRDVRTFDVQDIETALESAPAAHIWLSEALGKPVAGVETIEGWWAGFSNSTMPSLNPELVLAGRTDEASAFLDALDREPHAITVSAPSQDDVIAFVAAVLLTTPEDVRSDLLARALIVRDAYSLRVLDAATDLLILVPFDEQLRRDALRVRSHHVVLIGGDGTPADITLPPIPIEPAAAILRDLHVGEAIATKLAQAANRSLIAFQREAPAKPGLARRDWADFFTSKEVRRAWLAGGWSEQRSGDRDVLSDLLGASYEDSRDALVRASRGPDPLFTVTGQQWVRVLPEAALPYAQHAISGTDLENLERAVQTVLGAVDPALELPPEDRWKATLHGKTRIHSSTLREGIATTLALLGAQGVVVSLGSGRTGQTWTESMIFGLLRRANEDPTGQLWASLSDVLPLLAEAAPDVFLNAVQAGSSGDEPVLTRMFLDRVDPGALSISSPHTGLLWALEGIAWSQDHASLAAELLARLAELDPGGRLSNRPSGSLTSIFRPWLPQTSALAEARLKILDGLLTRHPEAGWTLLLSLLPEHYGVGDYTHAPRFRDWKPEAQPPVTRKEFWEMSSSISVRAIDLAENTPERWAELIDRVDDLPPMERTLSLDRLEALAEDVSLTEDGRAKIWSALGEVVRKHRAFADAEWAMAAEDVNRLDQIATQYRPTDQVTANLWLFKSFVPQLGEGKRSELADYEERLREFRESAARAIFSSSGVGGLIQAADAAEAAWAVGHSVATSGIEIDEFAILSFLDDASPKRAECALGFAAARVQERGWEWIDTALPQFKDRPRAQARVLRMSDDLPKAWARAEEAGKTVEDEYWKEFVPYGRGGDFPPINEAAARLLSHGRVAMAIDALAMYSHNGKDILDAELVASALEALTTLKGDDPELRIVSNYDIESLLAYVRPRIDEDRAALLEWKLLPALGPFAASPLLHRRLARDPAFFVEILSLCFRAKSDTGEQQSVPQAVASNAWHLLHEWKILPGAEDVGGVVDEEALRSWVRSARQLAKEADRREIADVYIGQVFAHAREDDDGTWPTLPVRNTLESVASTELEDGFRTGTYNKRGVTSRSLTEGGRQEREFTARYREYALKVKDGWPRTAAVLRSLAEGYESEARMHDEQAERFLKGTDV